MKKKDEENNQKTISENKELGYSKENLIKSKKFDAKKDLLNALLEDNKSYTISEVEKIINEYLERVV